MNRAVAMVYGILAICVLAVPALADVEEQPVPAEGIEQVEVAEDATIVFLSVPAGTTITYVNLEGATVTEPLEVGKEYPADGVITFGSQGVLRVRVTGNPTPATIQGDTGATFNMAGSSAVGGIVVNVPEGQSNVRMQIGAGTGFRTVPAGTSSSPSGTRGTQGPDQTPSRDAAIVFEVPAPPPPAPARGRQPVLPPPQEPTPPPPDEPPDTYL